MSNPERAKMIPVTGNNDQPDLSKAVDVQFNPSTLKVNLANTLKENKNNGNSRAAQFVDKSSSTLTVELFFDTTFVESAQGSGGQQIEAGSDVRLLTKRIAETFLKPEKSGDKLKAPSRCLFQWGAFEFLGLVQSFDETLDFFSPEGRPLRATVSLKLSESRYQFRNRAVNQAARQTPQLTPTGNGGAAGNGRPDGGGAPVPGASGDGAGNWRDTAMFNGIESPRMPSASMLAVPQISANAAIGVSGGIGFSASASLSASASASFGAGVAGSATAVGPAFKFGASTSLGTGIEGAFSVGSRGGINAGALGTGGATLRGSASTSAGVSASASVRASGGVGFD